MIIIYSKTKNVKDLQQKYAKDVECYLEKSGRKCSLCAGRVKKMGKYKRGLYIGKTIRVLYIQRIVCLKCTVSQALLPCYILPQAKYSTSIKSSALEMYIAGYSQEYIAEKTQVDRRTVNKWIARFLAHSKPIQKWAGKKLATVKNAANEWLSGIKNKGRKYVKWLLGLLEKAKKEENIFWELDFWAYLNLHSSQIFG